MQETLRHIYRTTTTSHDNHRVDMWTKTAGRDDSSSCSQIDKTLTTTATTPDCVTIVALPNDLLLRILDIITPLGCSHIASANTEMRRIVHDDELWRQRLTQRWFLRQAWKSKQGASSFQQLFRVWHQARRLPTFKNNVVFARTSLKQVQSSGIVAGVTCRSSMDCRTSHGNLNLRVAVQNVAGCAVALHLNSFEVHLKDGLVLKDGDGVVVEVPKNRANVVMMNYPDFTVINFTARLPGSAAEFEPYCMDRCSRFCFSVSSSAAASRTAVACSFNDELVWSSYTCVNSNFWQLAGS